MRAVGDFCSGMGTTFLVIDEAENQTNIAGYITLRTSALFFPGEDGKPLIHPAMEIAELAVAEAYERQGIGTALLAFAADQADELRKEYLGIKSLVVIADPMAVGFYTKYGFSEVSTTYDVLYNGDNNNCIPMALLLPEQKFA